METSRFKLPLHVIAYPKNELFVGRVNLLQDLSKKFLPVPRPERTRTPAFAIWGNPGQGKTQTALRFAYSKRASFDSILWVSADREQKLFEGFSQYALSLGLITESIDLVRDTQKLIDWYQKTATKWLLIYDNAEDTILVNKYWPGRSQNGAIIITSRDQVFATTTVAGDGQELQPLSEDAAISMLKDGIKAPHCDIEEATKIVKCLGRSPLGVQAAIGLINDAQLSLTTFNEHFSSPKNLLDAVQREHIFRSWAPYEKTLAQVWFEELDRVSNASAEGMRMVEIIALLDPDNIQEQLLMDGLNRTDKDHQKLLGTLTKSFMVLKRLVSTKTLKEGVEPRHFFVHRQLQICTQRRMTLKKTQEETFKSATAILSRVMSSHWQYNWENFKREYTEYFPHVQAVHQFYREISDEGQQLQTISVLFLEMLRKAAGLCYKRNFFQHGFDLLKTAQDILATPSLLVLVVGPQETTLFESVEVPYMRACIATEIGYFRMSLENFQMAYKAFKEMKCKGFKKENEYFLIGGLANSYNGLNHNIEAQRLFRQCIEYQPAHAVDSPYDCNLARCLWAHGEDEEASHVVEDFMRRRAKAFGPDDIKDYLAGHAMYILGNIRIGQDRLVEAYQLHERALTCWKQTYGVHHKTGDANYKLAWHLAYRKEWDKALSYLEAALEIFESGSDQKFRQGEIARTVYKKGLILSSMGHLKCAKENISKAEGRRRVLLGSDYFPSSGEVSYDCLISLWAR